MAWNLGVRVWVRLSRLLAGSMYCVNPDRASRRDAFPT